MLTWPSWEIELFLADQEIRNEEIEAYRKKQEDNQLRKMKHRKR